MSRNRRDARRGFLFGAPAAAAPTWVVKFPFADRKTDSQSVGFGVNGSHLGLAKLHVTHSKDEKRP